MLLHTELFRYGKFALQIRNLLASIYHYLIATRIFK